MRSLRSFLAFLLVAFGTAGAAAGVDGPFVGVQLGASEPTNGFYRGQVQTGATGSPFAGYMLNKYIGVQGQLHFIFQEPDNDHRGFAHENQSTTLFGATVGPRLSLPLSDLDLHLPVLDLLELYSTVQGGLFTGLSGRAGKTNGGFLAGLGLDVNVTPQVAVGLFANFNRAYISARPHSLYRQVEDEQGPADAQWTTAGVSVKYSFRAPEAPPPPPPPPPPLAAPTPKTEVILRAVHFDFDKYDLRPDAVPVLDEAVRILKSKGGEVWIIQGHTDSTGAVKYNLKLSLRRAEAVKLYFVKHGIPDERVRIEGLGKSKPLATNATPEGRAQNRRVEIHVE